MTKVSAVVKIKRYDFYMPHVALMLFDCAVISSNVVVAVIGLQPLLTHVLDSSSLHCTTHTFSSFVQPYHFIIALVVKEASATWHPIHL